MKLSELPVGAKFTMEHGGHVCSAGEQPLRTCCVHGNDQTTKLPCDTEVNPLPDDVDGYNPFGVTRKEVPPYNAFNAASFDPRNVDWKKPILEKASCKTCRYSFEMVNEPPGVLHCRRFPPTAIGEFFTSLFRHPVVAPFDWCGEYQPEREEFS